MHTWDFLATLADMDLLLLGLWNTIKVFIFALAFGIPLGFGLALGRMSRIPVLSQICSLIIEVCRTTPPLVHLFWCSVAFPILISVQMTPFVASVMTFSIQSSAFFAEIFRGGINSIDKGQWEAAKAIGMTRQSSLRRIILPQAVKRMIPAFAERSIELLKTTTLISTVSYADLMFPPHAFASKPFRPPAVSTVVAVMYFFLILIFSQLTIRLEYRLARSGEGTLR